MVSWDVLISPFLLPVSFLWDSLTFLRLWLHYWTSRPEEHHQARVARVQEQVRRQGGQGAGAGP